MSKVDILFIGIMVGAFSFAIVYSLITKEMTPMDVYQGKTTLEYKVVDGVKVDSTVVWKDDR